MAKNFITLSPPPPSTVQLPGPAFASSDTNGFSDLIYIGGSSLTGLFIPGSASSAAWTPANLAVYAALPNGSQTSAANYAPLYRSDGSQYVIALPSTIPSTGLIIAVNPYDFVGLDAIQFQSVSTSSSSTAVTQTNSPTINMIVIANGSF